MNHNHPFRLLQTGHHRGFYNMGLDEALLEAVSGGKSLPVLRFYGWNPPTVSVGYFQGLEEEVDLGACKRLGVDVVRRITGGGAVLHRTELTYSIIVPQYHPLAGTSPQDSYRIICAGIIGGLELLGVPSQFTGINDIVTGGRKVSGNAQTRRMGCVLQHGTVLLDTDVDLMFELLRVPAEKIKGKLIQEVKERVTGLRSILGRECSFEEALPVFVRSFGEALSLDFTGGSSDQAGTLTPDGPAPEEESRAQFLAREKFASREWLYKR
jgi:lipoate-protein ligase A